MLFFQKDFKAFIRNNPSKYKSYALMELERLLVKSENHLLVRAKQARRCVEQDKNMSTFINSDGVDKGDKMNMSLKFYLVMWYGGSPKSWEVNYNSHTSKLKLKGGENDE